LVQKSTGANACSFRQIKTWILKVFIGFFIFIGYIKPLTV